MSYKCDHILLNLFCIESWKNIYVYYIIFIYENIKQLYSFNIDNNKSCFLSSKSAAWFLKDYVTLNTGVMMLKIQIYHCRSDILKYLKTENRYFNILQYYCNFNQINYALFEHKILCLKTLNILLRNSTENVIMVKCHICLFYFTYGIFVFTNRPV